MPADGSPDRDRAVVLAELGGESPEAVARGGPEPWLGLALLGLMAVLPVWDIVSRRLGALRLEGSTDITRHLTLWVTLVGGALAARSGTLLTLSTTAFLPQWLAGRARLLSSAAGAAVCAVLAVASWSMVAADRLGGNVVALGLPVWAFELVMPVGYATVAAAMLWRSAPAWRGRGLAALGLLVPVALGFLPGLAGPAARAVLIAAVLVLTVAGLPLFACLSGVSLLLFWGPDTPLASVPAAAAEIVANPFLPAIPLFTLAGHLLAAGGACRRLVRVFDALVGWMPGGLAIVATVVFAFFASFTGGSGVTILSLGGLLLPILLRSGYPEPFAIGLLTASGSIGLLFPPSLPVILYGVRSFTMVNGVPYVAQIDQLFIGGLVPGLFLVLLVAGFGIAQARKSNVVRRAFDAAEARAALWEAKWELIIPVFITVFYFAGLTTLVEVAALTLIWSLIAEVILYRDLSLSRDVPRVAAEGIAMVGAVLLILGSAQGFTNYLVDARAHEALAAFVHTSVTSKWLFLLLLNVFMLVVGSLIEVYSAILVVVPLITPIGAAFGIHPVHLGIIFLANLELGYLFPPVGLNLLLSSSRFGKPMASVTRATFPFLLILLAGVLLITYVPFMSLGLLHLLAPAAP